MTYKVSYISGAEAMKRGLISEAQWRLAIAHPWAWVVLGNGTRIREIPWNGLEINETEYLVE